MADKPKGSHDYAKHQGDGTRKEAGAAARRPMRRTRFLFKFIGLLLVFFAGWWAWYSYKEGRVVDLTDPNQQQKALADVKKTAEATREASAQALAWASRGLGDLEKLIKGKPPETPADVKQLVDESKQAVAKEQAKPPTPGAPAAPEAAPAVEPPSLLADAEAEYRAGQEAYAKTDPMASQEQVQKFIRVAEPHFSKCLDLCDVARQHGAQGEDIGRLEQAAAKRLYDCRKRMELRRDER